MNTELSRFVRIPSERRWKNLVPAFALLFTWSLLAPNAEGEKYGDLLGTFVYRNLGSLSMA